MPFGLGAPELIIILVIVMLVFGVGKLPEVGGALGRGIREFKDNLTGKELEEDKTAERQELKG
ncbi:twin-arginine translocation protein, TatA/E family subunit [Thermobaculum terrenum ATCC BAA-798]|uniref:Sec-independent protein translocase protein TatA n=1 Tax=Thermobaculum terrenum (strain ATCC BAA-798 / CCMEE 7001 / YNP1) TaxID=525904 RepID=D1CFX8_THET1|nr:twin-arginine translocase TatA/TatE family subunit [Thermobaculum terrenum]ACZ41834.1 twin-arginine translocation protein, TatA/E family subunit [Thermobaculum terrenum ATCC BAA-798]